MVGAILPIAGIMGPDSPPEGTYPEAGLITLAHFPPNSSSLASQERGQESKISIPVPR